MNENEKKAYMACGNLITANMNDTSKKADVGWFTTFKIYQAVRRLKKLSGKYPENWPIKWIIGKGCQLLGKDQESYSYFANAAESNPDNADVYREATIQANKLGLGVESEIFADKAIQLRPDDSGLYANKALSFLIQGKLQEAEEAIITSLNMDCADKVSQNVHRLVIDVKEGRRDCPQIIP